MPTKIRLQRHGKKKYAYYHVVVADARAPRDGKFIEKLGSYNPNDNPATIDIDFDRCLHWVKTGAQPTDTCKALLSYKGVMHKDHLDRGVLKGAMTQEQADKKFEAWLKDKESKITGKKDGLAKATADAEKARMTAESVANEKKAAEVLAKNSALAEEAAAKAAPAAEVVTEEAAPVEEAKTEEVPVAEVVTEEAAPVEEAKAEEAPVAEEAKVEDAPAAEEKKTEE